MDIKGRDCGDQAAQWFTNFLKTEAFRLVQFEKHMKGRPSKDIFSASVPDYQVSFQGTALCFHQSPALCPAYFLPPRTAFLGAPVRRV